MHKSTRRDFLNVMGVAVAARTLPLPSVFSQPPSEEKKKAYSFDLGMASYTFRAFPLDQAIEMTNRLGLHKITLKDVHLPMKSSDREITVAIEKIRAAGMVMSSCGVVYMKSEEEIKGAFHYAQSAGLKMMIGVPDQPLLPIAERYVKETGIALAIHNHGPTDKRYPTPESVYTAIAGMDKRVGLCIDIGHTQRHGLDPSVEVERFFDRVFDLHVKDVTLATAEGTTVEMGRGVIDLPGLFKTLDRLNYSGTLHFEFEKDQKDPLPGVAESVGYARGILAALALK